MTDPRRGLQYLIGLAFIAVGVGGTVAGLVGLETVSPAFFAAAIAAVAGALPASGSGRCRIGRRVRAVLGSALDP